MADNRATLETVTGVEDINIRRQSVNGMPVQAMGPENVVVIGANTDYPTQVVPYSGIFLRLI